MLIKVFLENVLFTDEHFTNHGNINLRNLHNWVPNNSHWMREVDHQHPWDINAWRANAVFILETNYRKKISLIIRFKTNVA